MDNYRPISKYILAVLLIYPANRPLLGVSLQLVQPTCSGKAYLFEVTEGFGALDCLTEFSQVHFLAQFHNLEVWPILSSSMVPFPTTLSV